MVSVDIMPCTLLTPNMQSAQYLLASGMNLDLTNFWVVALRVSVACAKLSPHLSLRSSGVVLELQQRILCFRILVDTSLHVLNCIVHPWCLLTSCHVLALRQTCDLLGISSRVA